MATITQADVQHWVTLLAHDSMAGRFTPSPELDKAAEAIAAHFRQAGLRPAFGDSFIQRWPDRFRYGVPTAFAPNVGGFVEGSDSLLRSEYLVFVAHVDGVGRVSDWRNCEAMNTDSLCNGADDNASGTAGVSELAAAFAALNPGPGRSLLFLVVSGEETGLRGSRYFVGHSPVPLERIVGVVNLDMIGRNSPGEVFVPWMETSTMGDHAAAAQLAHWEEGIALLAFEAISSDHTAFTDRGIPALFFFDGNHADYHRGSDEAVLIDFSKATRVTRLAFWIGLDMANAGARPQWRPAAGTPPRERDSVPSSRE